MKSEYLLKPFIPDDDTLRQNIAVVMRGKTDSKESFSAYDVTNALRDAAGASVFIEHARVRPVVHEMMSRNFAADYLVKDNGVYKLYFYAPADRKVVFSFKNVEKDSAPDTASLSDLTLGETYLIPDSTVVLSLTPRYIPRDGYCVDVKFTSGKIYRYTEVGLELISNWLKAESKGRFFNEKVIGLYQAIPLT